MTSTISVERIGELDFTTKLKEENGRKTEYVSRVEFRNAGRNLFGGMTYWQEIEFGDEGSIDDLIAALVYVRTMRGYCDDGSGTSHWDECVQRSMLRCKNECEAERTDEGWKCEWCGEVTTSKYEDKPHRCSKCGAYFTKHNEDEVSDGEDE